MSSMNEIIRACNECHSACLEALVFHGDKAGGRQLSSQHIKRLVSCMEICQTTSNMLTIGSPLLDRICEICAYICEQCATSCSHASGRLMERCVEACKACAGACLEESYNLKQAS